MFSRVFKKKERGGRSESAQDASTSRRHRLSFHPTAVQDPTMKSEHADNRRSLQEGMFLYREVSRRRESGISQEYATRCIPGPSVDASTPLRQKLPRSPLYLVENAHHSSPAELQNPFNIPGDTLESPPTLNADSCTIFAHSTDDVLTHRMVPTYLPKRLQGPPRLEPQRALIFTEQGVQSSDDDESSSDGDEVSPVSPRSPDTPSTPFTPITPVTPISPSMPAAPPVTPTADKRMQAVKRHSSMLTGASRRSQWNLMRSPKRRASQDFHSTDFLEVQIPSGVFTPPSRERHPFWSRT